MKKENNKYLENFKCGRCGNKGTIYLERELKIWLCEHCYFKDKEE